MKTIYLEYINSAFRENNSTQLALTYLHEILALQKDLLFTLVEIFRYLKGIRYSKSSNSFVKVRALRSQAHLVPIN